MRIVFICGSQEAGKDGVGDYTRRLACEVIRQGHYATIIAIGDKYIKFEKEETQQDEDTLISVYRLSSSTSWTARLEAAKAAIDKFRPDWISLQFVLFTFEKKGLPFFLANKLISINCVQAKWHIMFHELWAGMDKFVPLKIRLLGIVQKQILFFFLKRLKPSVIHTHAYVYQEQLRKLNFQVMPLPLFTNLFINESIYTISQAKNGIREGTLIFTLFGGIHPDAPITNFADELLNYTKQKNIKPEVRIVGRAGNEQEIWQKVLWEKNIDVKITGELTVEEVTNQLYESNYGLSTTPRLLADKSSSVATMLGHGLPVICVAKKHQIGDINDNSVVKYIFNYEPGNLPLILNAPIDKAKAATLTQVASTFIYNLSSTKSC